VTERPGQSRPTFERRQSPGHLRARTRFHQYPFYGSRYPDRYAVLSRLRGAGGARRQVLSRLWHGTRQPPTQPAEAEQGRQPADTPSGGGHQPADTPSGTGTRPPEPRGVESGPDRPGEHGRPPPEHRSPRGAPHPNASGSRFSKGTLTAVSLLSALVAILFLPPVLGGISIYSGYKVYDVYDESLGGILVVVGVLATIVGMALGVLLLTA